MSFTPEQLHRVSVLRMRYAEKVGRECDLGVDTMVELIDKNPKANDDKLIQIMDQASQQASAVVNGDDENKEAAQPPKE